MRENSSTGGSEAWKIWAGLLISALFLYYAFLHVDMGRAWAIIAKADLFFLGMAILVTLMQFLIRAWRWRILLIPFKVTGFGVRIFSLLTGFAANCVLPARLGEFVRAACLGRAENMSKSAVFGTVVIERVLDGFCLIIILVIGVMSVTLPDNYSALSSGLHGGALSVLAAYLLVILFIIGFRHKTGLFINVFNRIFFFLSPGLREKGTDSILNFSSGLVPLKGFYSWAQVLIYSVMLWGISLFQIQFIELSINAGLPFTSTFIVQAMAFIGVSVPLAPGYIGPFHLAVQYGFLFSGLGREESLSAAILLHASFYLPTVVLGAMAFAWMQFEKYKGK